MDVVRITELQPKTYVEQGDYIAIDNQNDGTKKVQFTNLLDNTLSQENKIAPANVVGQRFTNMSASVAQDIADVEADVNTLRAAVGSPLKASTVAQMTDKNKIYVYVGSESGYTNGNWYYWNGSAWTSGGVYNSVAVVTDPTLTLSGVPADAKATGDEVTNLKSELTDETNARILLAGRMTTAEGDIDTLNTHKVAQPLDEYNQPTDGTDGQSLRTKGDGTTEWADVGLPTDAQTSQAVSDWLDGHPEATTTVQDGSLTEPKFSEALKKKAIKDYVTPEMFGAKGDGVTDDTNAIKAAVAAGDSILFVNNYKVSETIFLPGGKNLDIFGTIHYIGSDKLFHMSNQFNIIDGHSVGTITGDGGSGTLVWITTTDERGTERYSYFNKVINITIRESARGIMLYNPEQGAASYFNTIDKCMFSGCPIGIELKAYANGNRINNIVFYNCGVANDKTKASVVLTEDNNCYPEENNFSQIFVTNSTSTVCFLINGRCYYNIFNEIIVEPGGTESWSFYTLDYTKIKNCHIQINDLTYNGGEFVNLDKSNTLITSGGVMTGGLSFSTESTPLSRTKCYTSEQAFAENAWIPLMTLNMANKRSMRVSLILYCTSANSFSNQYHDPLNTIVYNNGGYNVTNSDKFKVENNVLYFKSPPIFNGGLQFFFSIELTLGSRVRFRAGDIEYTMDSTWTEMQLAR